MVKLEDKKVRHMFYWNSVKTHFLLNPKLPHDLKEAYFRLYQKSPQLSSHIWITSSGTSGKLKIVALSKEALLHSAENVNAHLQSNASDVWALALPEFHVGGLGILARAHASGAQVKVFDRIDEGVVNWDPRRFVLFCDEENVTLTSLVPTQIYDLVSHNLSCPANIRAVFVGGGALSELLYEKARSLGWPVLPTYGLTECSSQVASASLSSLENEEFPFLEILPHLEVKKNEQGLLQFKSKSLLTGVSSLDYLGEVQFVDPKYQADDGIWFSSEDRGECDGKRLFLFGRESDFIKISGESVDFAWLSRAFQAAKIQMRYTGDAALVSIPDERKGFHIALAVNKFCYGDHECLLDYLNQHVPPFAKAEEVYKVDEIPRTPMGKVLLEQLRSKILG
ncbi:MAG: o-succinylbenzoate--CoA ligase [Deltaproteobacteria bacterium CG_4_10_14_0_2_um_filter_43_8]|nr:MAG: o-succinylbenzoate--CoA ligase [Deltaproteobacteria bacterium CG11_big_fil_rev_8_21_14_0_20_42_23]PJA22077.1 MAG: o-succinylbenzoate--CoA ligase [Deltaproteobacteria bacterium CG_4_10_14_0_2_um_filter_43_8]PJC65253.1 MAG: o-succinylbenzoate--CoA ligase [Deltaproteobacteria bacterium CG_4_9_14_0_2_um_filter_42_21]